MKSYYYLDLERAVELGIFRLGSRPPTAAEDGATPDGESVEGAPGAWEGVAEKVDADRFEKLLQLLPWTPEGDVGQREVLHYIQENAGTTVPAIAAHFEVSTSVIVGIINGGLQRNIAKAGFPDRKAILDIIQEGRKWHYYPGEVLKALDTPDVKKRPKRV